MSHPRLFAVIFCLSLGLSLAITSHGRAQEAVQRAEAAYAAVTPLPLDARAEAADWAEFWSQHGSDAEAAAEMAAERVAELERMTARDTAMAAHALAPGQLGTLCPPIGLEDCRVLAGGFLAAPVADDVAEAPLIYWQQVRGRHPWGMPQTAVALFVARGERLQTVAWVQTAIHHAPPELVAHDDGAFIAVPGYHDGTGHMNADVLFGWTPGAERPLRQIDVTGWKTDLAQRLPPGLEVWKGVAYRWSGLMAETALWQEYDANCCPTGGRAWVVFDLVDDRLTINHLQVDDPVIAAAATTSPGILAWASRRQACDHWAGEEAYDAERGTEIAAALAQLDCATLDADEAALMAAHAGDTVTLALMARVRGRPPEP